MCLNGSVRTSHNCPPGFPSCPHPPPAHDHGKSASRSETPFVCSLIMVSNIQSLTHAFSCSSVIFLLHIALEIPVAMQGLFSPVSLPFLQMNNTAAVFIKARLLRY